MAFVEDLHEDDLPEICAADRAQAGYLPNYSRVWAHRPEAYAAWKQLAGAIKSSTDKRRYELATLAAARRLRSSYCALAHGKVLADRFHDATDVAAFASDHRTAGLNEVDVAVMDFAEKVADDATAVTRADIDRLRQVGLSDVDAVDIALTAAARCFFSKTLDALGVEPDSAYRDLDPALRDALTVGRPIAAP
jgi:uncharacterized peroxidase-related enzyme